MMAEVFKNTVNIWSVYDKQYLPAFIKYIKDTHGYDLYYDRKRTMWTKNLDFDIGKNKCPKTKKVEYDHLSIFTKHHCSIQLSFYP